MRQRGARAGTQSKTRGNVSRGAGRDPRKAKTDPRLKQLERLKQKRANILRPYAPCRVATVLLQLYVLVGTTILRHYQI